MLMHQPGRVLVAAHRGVSSANIPCNTKTAFQIALAQGADIIELDVARSVDGKLFVFHPGMEKPHLHIDCALSELTAKEIEELRFVNQDDVPTSYGVSYLEDIFTFLKDKAYINVDKYWLNMEEITHAIRRAGVEKQVIVKTHADTEEIDHLEKCAPDLMFMPVVKEKDEISDYILEKNVKCVGVEAIFATDEDDIVSDSYIEQLHKRGWLIYGDAIVYNEKRNIAAGHTDDIALAGDLATGWGWYVQKKFDIIQTDWCMMLKKYLTTGAL